MIKKEILNNQALTSSSVFFDDVNRDIRRYADEEGNLKGEYIKKPKGVEILENGDVIFRFIAPNAKEVEVAGIGGTMGNEHYKMEKGENGVWSVKVSGIGAGFHYHDYYVDGNMVTSELAPYGYGCFRIINYFDMPNNDSAFYLMNDVPHGTIRMDYYKSEITGKIRSCFVYTPPSYETSLDKNYPVLYLQHGGGESESGWIWQGKVNYILDNLIASGEAEEMIVVMNNGYAFTDAENENTSMGSIGDVIVNDCVPFIDGKYRTIANKHGRAVAGLSMGGFQAQQTAMRHLDVIGNLGMLSATLLEKYAPDDYSDLFQNPTKFNEELDLFYVAAGDKETGLIENTFALIVDLRKKGAKIVTYVTPGYHEWQVWRYSIKEFLKLVFKNL